MKLLIALQHRFELWNAPPWFAERLRRDFPQIEVVHRESYEGIEAQIADAEIAVTWSLRPEQFAVARKLRWIHSPAAAVHQLLFPELVNSDVVLTNAREVHGPVVAEHVMALLFALAKRIPAAVKMQQRHLWGQQLLWENSPRPRELAGATLGLVGLGSIGLAVARHARELDMTVIATREHPEKRSPASVDRVYPAAELDRLLGESDWIVLAVPVTGETRGLMNAERIGRMKSDAFLINVGRGTLVDEKALADALRERRIAGAALDVFEKEPLPADSPLWDLENLLITPHSAGLTDKLWERHYRQVTGNLQRYLAGEPLLSMVDKHAGY
jgi:phosphoglycerate dehydrogenase-like enzyme